MAPPQADSPHWEHHSVLKIWNCEMRVLTFKNIQGTSFLGMQLVRWWSSEMSVAPEDVSKSIAQSKGALRTATSILACIMLVRPWPFISQDQGMNTKQIITLRFMAVLDMAGQESTRKNAKEGIINGSSPLCSCGQNLEHGYKTSIIVYGHQSRGEVMMDIKGVETPMDNDCFNTAVRMLACDEGVLFADPPVHYMDLRFCDGYELRKQFLLYLLKHRGNEAKENIPDIVKEFLKRIIWILIVL
ncbi:hypothetical protein TRIUR3_29319 [Triticum urartu]|uniref:Uncharacterized protein n=1 Tax=Triticum urartu TaxID=4572 RepID=M7ZIB8_TRIUA|nr:hypothetical protein TRIUR3_29319 [Triticum urartu]